MEMEDKDGYVKNVGSHFTGATKKTNSIMKEFGSKSGS